MQPDREAGRGDGSDDRLGPQKRAHFGAPSDPKPTKTSTDNDDRRWCLFCLVFNSVHDHFLGATESAALGRRSWREALLP